MAKMPNLRHQNNPQLMDDVMVAKSTLKKQNKLKSWETDRCNQNQSAGANDSACPPFTKAVSVTITRALFTLLKQMERFASGFKEHFTCKEALEQSQQ